MTTYNQSIPYNILLHKCDVNVVNKIMAYHGEYNYWKFMYKNVMNQIKTLKVKVNIWLLFYLEDRGHTIPQKWQ